MPGMPYHQHVGAVEKESSPLEDVFSFETDSFPDILVINPFQFQTVLQEPLIRSRHKACRSSQAQLKWIFTAQEDVPVKYSPRNCDVHSNAFDRGNGEGENDLADMVRDFMENGSCGQHEIDARDNETGTAVPPKLYDGLQALTTTLSSIERDIASIVMSVVISANELDRFCPNDSIDCGGSCIRHLAVKHLQKFGYNASVCRSKWLNTCALPGGEYEYIDVSVDEEHIPNEEVIIDTDFRSQFEIARPSQHYQTALKSLPVIFVGKSRRLEQVLQIMSEAAKCSLNQNSMHLPPWRTLDYMRAKWLSPHNRISVDAFNQQFQRCKSLVCKTTGVGEGHPKAQNR